MKKNEKNLKKITFPVNLLSPANSRGFDVQTSIRVRSDSKALIFKATKLFIQA